MKSKKEIKAYHSHDADVQIGKMQKEAKTLAELIKLLKEVTGDKEINTIGAFTQWLCKEAGFKSASFSAESMDLKDAYDNAHRLSNSMNLIGLGPAVLSSLSSLFQIYMSVKNKKR